MGICRLCLEDKKLIKAHIIPDFMYNGMKDDNNIFHSMKDISDEIRLTKLQTGEFDKTILCEDCDNRILGGKYEKYAKSIIFSEKLNLDSYPIYKAENGKNFSILNDISYNKIKLFLLSILWRASITKRPFFKEVNLGQNHENRIKEILYKSIIPDELEYPILATSFSQTKHPLQQVIAQPKKIKFPYNIKGYIFSMRGLNFIFLVNSVNHNLPVSLKESIINKNNEITVFYDNNKQDFNILNSILK
ncbi:hypothetical protein ACJRPK_09425 [Aquimarina sp. 2-A2]|uniref:hypothetical protein n=1 Tax=Aquimarina sp. 2-A2 TaxID=3382644 RepID=UPI00387F1015